MKFYDQAFECDPYFQSLHQKGKKLLHNIIFLRKIQSFEIESHEANQFQVLIMDYA